MSSQGSLWSLLKERKKVKSLSRVRLFATPWTVAYQAPRSMEFSRQEYWSGLPFPSPGHLPVPFTKIPLLKPNHLPESHLQLPSHWGLDFNIWMCGGHMYSVYGSDSKERSMHYMCLASLKLWILSQNWTLKNKNLSKFLFLSSWGWDMSVLTISSSESNKVQQTILLKNFC